MNDDEKLYLMIKIMEDLRGDWSRRCIERVNKVEELAIELGYPLTVALVNDYVMESEETGDWDGRYFRRDWSSGGYVNAPLPQLETYSAELLMNIKSFCNYPEYALPKFDVTKEKQTRLGV
jgi:hypothetical protein